MPNYRLFRNKIDLISQEIGSSDSVLDIGFQGQGIQSDQAHWPHAVLLSKAREVCGVDLEIDRERFPDTERYQQASAEDFSFAGKRFDVIFAGDVIEHLPNPGLFLTACKRHMGPESRLVITTPNCFSLFNLTEKITKDEPTVNSDHTCYFNRKTLAQLLEKCGLILTETAYLYSLEYSYKESWKKKVLNIVYRLVSKRTYKFSETLVMKAAIAPN